MNETKSIPIKYLFDPIKTTGKATLFSVGSNKEWIIDLFPLLEMRSTFFAALDSQDVVIATTGKESIEILKDDPTFGVDQPVNVPFHLHQQR